MALFGTEFINGATVLMILLVGVVVNVATGAVSEILMMSGFEKDCRNVNLSGAVLIIVLCAVLIPMAGVVGTAISVTIGIAGKNLLMVYMVYKRLGFWPISIYFKVNT